MKLSEKIDAIKALSSELLKPISIPSTEEHANSTARYLDILLADINGIIHNKKFLHELAPRFLLRRWGVASFWMAKRKIKQAKKSILRGDQSFAHQAHFAALWAYQTCDFFYANNFFDKAAANVENYILYTSHLEKGDVIVSYKTNTYLRFSMLSNIIAFASNTHITHAFIVTGEEKPHQLLSSKPESKGLGLSATSPHKGEMFIVLRYTSSVSGVPKERILESLDSWWPTQQPSYHGKKIVFAELKSWVACYIGFIYLITTYLFGRSVCFPNPIHQKGTIFCSEFIDTVFKQAGVYLSPRSENPSVVSPVELFYSPYLQFKGIIFHAADQEQILREFHKPLQLNLV